MPVSAGFWQEEKGEGEESEGKGGTHMDVCESVDPQSL